MTIVWTGLMPHPPIIVPDVGRDRLDEVRATVTAMHDLAADLVAHRPARLVVVSPHAPRPYRGVAAWQGPAVAGDFSRFGAPRAALELPVDTHWITRFSQAHARVTPLTREPLDHGSTMPLWFAVAAGWQGPTCVVGLPAREGEALDPLTAALAAACADDVPTAVVASGDMSHCLKEDGPYGYDPRGPAFDTAFTDCLRRADYRGAGRLDPVLEEEARQDVTASCLVVWGASAYRSDHHRFYSYEGPFGVGYTVMKFFSEAA